MNKIKDKLDFLDFPIELLKIEIMKIKLNLKLRVKLRNIKIIMSKLLLPLFLIQNGENNEFTKVIKLLLYK